ncbi:hypothetical protein D3C87_86330 [compost metagenome]
MTVMHMSSIESFLGVIAEMIERGWEGFLERPGGHLGLRFYIQPGVAILLAVRDGIRDSKRGGYPFLSAIFHYPVKRRQILKNAWLQIRNVFFVSVILDIIYQFMKHEFVIYPMETVFTATCLALVPYVIFRSLTGRFAKIIMKHRMR